MHTTVVKEEKKKRTVSVVLNTNTWRPGFLATPKETLLQLLYNVTEVPYSAFEKQLQQQFS